MRRAIATALLALIAAGCHREPRFDDRYNETARNVENRAAALDVELNQASAPARDRPAPR
jgi:hypothetical protein